MLYSQTTGSGVQHIIFVHGNSQSLETWNAIAAYKALNRYSLVAVDLPGHGLSFRSSTPQSDYSLKGLGRQLREFLTLYNERDFVLVGVSLGCNVIAEASPLPPACKGVFLLGPQIIGVGLTTGDIIKPNPAITAAFSDKPDDDTLDAFLDNMASKLSPELREKCRNVFLKTDASFREYLSESIARQDWSDEVTSLKSLDIPLAIVYGIEERFVFTNYLNKTDLKIWRDEIILIPGAGHFAHLDQPELVAKLISEFANSSFL